jgi:hypothetical protein
MPFSLHKKIKKALSNDEYQDYITACSQRPSAPDESSLASFIDEVLGKCSTRQELKEKLPLIQGVFRLYRVRTYSRNSVTTFKANNEDRYSIQLQCRTPSCPFKVSLIFAFDQVEQKLKCHINPGRSDFGHCCHSNEDEWKTDMGRVKQTIAGVQSYLKTPSFSAAQAISQASTDEENPPIPAAVEKGVRRNAQELCQQENEKEVIRDFFDKNNFTYRFIGDESVCWASPAMKRALETFDGPLNFDATHSIPVLGYRKGEGRKAKLYQFLTPGKEGEIVMLAQALAYSESENVATSILQWVKSLFGGNPPQIIYSDDAPGFRKAVATVFPEPTTFHRGCGYHVICNWNKRLRHFENKVEMNEAKVWLRKCIVSLDLDERKKCWAELERLCVKNLGEAHRKFLDYYRKALCFWSLAGIPRSVFVYSSFSNSIVESANGIVQKKGILDANSTLRVIFIASKSFDKEVKTMNVMECPPVVTAKVEHTSQDERKELLKSLRDCSSPIKWARVPDNLTCKCLQQLIFSFKKSNSYHAYRDRPGIFRVVPDETTSSSGDPETALVVENSDSLLVCTSCYWFNVHGSPCPHVLSACKSFRANENWLPFINRNLKAGKGVDIKDMLSHINVEHRLLGVLSRDDVLDIQEMVHTERVPADEMPDESDEEFPDHFEEVVGAHQSKYPPANFHEEIHVVPKRIDTAEIKFEEAMGNGSKAEAARKWLWENVAYPAQKKSSYDKEEFIHYWRGFTKTRDEYQGEFQRLFSRPHKKKASMLSGIGNSQNLKAHTSPALGSKRTAKKRQVPETQKPTGASTKKKTSNATTTAKKRQVPETQKPTRASTKKKSSATTYEVDEFLQEDKKKRKILVGWRHHTDITWEPIEKLKEDLGSTYDALYERMEKRAKANDDCASDTNGSESSSDDDDTPLSSLMGSRNMSSCRSSFPSF